MTSSDFAVVEPPGWLRWLANDAARCVTQSLSSAPLGCHFHYDAEGQAWEVTLFVSRAEVLGGELDGLEIPAGVGVDILGVLAVFESVMAVTWQAERLSGDDDLGAHLSFAGRSRGNEVWLRILGHAPVWAGVGQQLNSQTGEFEDLW